MMRATMLAATILGGATGAPLSAQTSGAPPAAPAAPATPTADATLATPPADAVRYTILSAAGTHGDVQEWTAADGALMGRMHMVLRGQIWEEDERITLGRDGAIATYRLRGTSPLGDLGETFQVASGKATWKSSIDAGSAAYAQPAFYLPAGNTIRAYEPLVRRLIATPGASVALLPGGSGRAQKLTTTEVGAGATRRTVTLWAISGIYGTPFTVYTDEKGELFAQPGAISTIRAGYEADAQRLVALEDTELAKQSPILARTLASTPAGPVAFTGVRAFLDGRFVDGQTVVVDRGRIVAVGPSARVAVPAGAQEIAGAGRTLVPGLWDSHMHVGGDFAGPKLLSLGVTSLRDPGNDDALTIARAKRRAAGDLLMPHVYASSLIDGKGPNTAQVANVATSQAEAIKLVDDAKAKGMKGVKFYGSLNPEWIAAAAAEAHKLGLHVHGHLPAGIRPMDAIDRGYDELTHIYFVSMQAMPDEIVRQSNGIGRFLGTGRYMKDVDLDGEPMKSLIATMAARHIVSDPTLVVLERLFVPDNGDLSPAYAPFVGTLPPSVERGFRQGGVAPPSGVTRADYRASFAKEVELVGRMHRAGIPIVAGTDGSGLELVRELELYVQAGFTPGEALEAATIVPARLVGADATTGSIAVGKVADLVLVRGDPSQRIGDLRHTEVVMMDGRLMQADKLRGAVGVGAPPRFEESE